MLIVDELRQPLSTSVVCSVSPLPQHVQSVQPLLFTFAIEDSYVTLGSRVWGKLPSSV